MIERTLRDESSLWLLGGAAFGLMLLSDVAAGMLSETAPLWLLAEVVLMGLVLSTGGWLWQANVSREGRLDEARSEITQLQQQLSRRTEVLSSTQQQLSRQRSSTSGLSSVIEAQFSEWSLSGAEDEVGTLLLKGLSLKEISSIRETSERTTRKQAQAVYRKAGLSGRAELSAYFLEDLLAPISG
jgi:DNA-binding CsgD family transcriptional regulator